MKFEWYWRRLRRMAPNEVVWRTRDAVVRGIWRNRHAFDGTRRLRATHQDLVSVLPSVDRTTLPASALDRLLRAAQSLLDGQWLVFGCEHPSFGEYPDWFVDASSGRRASIRYSFDIPYRNEATVGNIKYIWEPSRHHHLTVLAAAYAVTGDERYAERVASHLRSWWSENPFLSGPHWISGIELGIRLIAWVWIRQLLQEWPQASALFEHNPHFIDQLYNHQKWLATLPSRGSSANNHLIAEAAGQFIAACAFPWFSESEYWRAQSARVLRHEIIAQTFASGLNRELATDYHGLTLELFLASAIEGELSGHPLGASFWERCRAMIDALAAVVDARGCPPRQGDGDEGIGLLLDGPDYDRWHALLATGRRLFGALPWWPDFKEDDLRTFLWTRSVTPPPLPQARPSARPHLFADAGQVYLRDGSGTEEIWCRCDHGPHGFLSIAAHAHADALSIELRVGGVQILADPGTYCYHGEPGWRSYFRSTLGHNTLELMARDQSVSGGPFLWTRHAESRLRAVSGLEESALEARWEAEHNGYLFANGPVHRRAATLDRQAGTLTIRDEIRGLGGSVPVRLRFHLGPEVTCSLDYRRAVLSWPGGAAELALPSELTWTQHRGELSPPLGWFSPSFGRKVPSSTLLGVGHAKAGLSIVSQLTIRRGTRSSVPVASLIGEPIIAL